MFRLELTKLWRQNKIIPCIMLLLMLMVGSLEISTFTQGQRLSDAVETSEQTIKELKQPNPFQGTKQLLPETKSTISLLDKQLVALKRRDGTSLREVGVKQFIQKWPMLSYSGDNIIDFNLHSGEVEATRKELVYLQHHQLPTMLPLTIRTNPQTALTNNVPVFQDKILQELTQRFYVKGWEQIWLWSMIGGIMIALAAINIFLGDILANERDSQNDHTTWLRLQHYGRVKMVFTKLGVHLVLSCLMLFTALGIFLVYASLRNGLGDLRYPVQAWALGKKVVSPYLWLTATAEANYFAPLQITFIPLARYLGLLGIFGLVVLFLNSTLTLLINRLVRMRLLALLIMVALPLLGLVLPASIYNPYTYLNGDWVVSNYLGYFLSQRAAVYPWVISGIGIAAIVCLVLALIPLKRKQGGHFG
ncbi:hypothetical protein [Schleiferilactobacillus perolens]|jgi:hypothetical protein|uniref:hypothetical protein n=1 Tax=Schleiferilactobacillus perolens TaxID=100468 RepID=UPI002353CCFE|nr:hypothetical protein [Schleiferilactobacillus perolens]MCI2170347.1 hypothetical protein [Schleiferilactobacillus perolens]